MKKKTKKYKAAPAAVRNSILREELIEDYLPAPEQLVFKEENERVTLNLSKNSVQFFKQKSKELGIPYQRMIKRLLDAYARKYKESR